MPEKMLAGPGSEDHPQPILVWSQLCRDCNRSDQPTIASRERVLQKRAIVLLKTSDRESGNEPLPPSRFRSLQIFRSSQIVRAKRYFFLAFFVFGALVDLAAAALAVLVPFAALTAGLAPAKAASHPEAYLALVPTRVIVTGLVL